MWWMALGVLGACVGGDKGGDTDKDGDTFCSVAMPCTGDANISSSSDFDAIAQCASIAGSLRIDDQEWLTNIDLPCLTSVDTLGIMDNDSPPCVRVVVTPSSIMSTGGEKAEIDETRNVFSTV